MARIVIVHGAFNELWGPNELKARWLPAVRDGLWHHGAAVEADDVAICFYGDLFRHHPGSAEDRKFEQSRAGVADMLSELGADDVAKLSQLAGEATFDRTIDLATAMLAENDLRDRLRARIEAEITDDTRVLVAHSLGTVLSYSALALHEDWPVHTFVTLGSPLAAPMIFGSWSRRLSTVGAVARLGAALGQRPRAERRGLREQPGRPFRTSSGGVRDRQRAPRPRTRALPQLRPDRRGHRRRAGQRQRQRV